MGWFKKTLTKVVKSKFGKAMDTFSAAFSSPVSSFKAITTPYTFKELTKEYMEKPLSTRISKTVVSTAGYMAATVAVGAVAAKGVLATAAKLIPTTLKGKVVAAVAVPFAAAYVIKKPEVIEQLSEVPATAFQAGVIAAEPTLAGAWDFVKAHPYLSGAALGAALAAAGYGAVIIAKVLGKAKKPKVEEAVAEAVAIAPAVVEVAPGAQLIPEKPVGIEGEIPLTPETTTITTGKKPYKRRRAKITPSVRQYVRVNVISKPVATGMRITNKRYISQELLN